MTSSGETLSVIHSKRLLDETVSVIVKTHRKRTVLETNIITAIAAFNEEASTAEQRVPVAALAVADPVPPTGSSATHARRAVGRDLARGRASRCAIARARVEGH